MKKKYTFKLFLWVALLLPVLLTLKPDVANATHFRYGHLTWQPIAGANNVRFTLVNAFRRADNDYPGTYGDGYVAVGDIITETIGLTGFDFGDGNQTGTLQYKVISVDVANDWFLAQALDPGSTTKTTIDHHYSTANNAGSPWLAQINSCCRTGVELNNPGAYYRVLTYVDLSNGNTSPSSSLPAIVNMPYASNASFVVTAADPDPNTVLTYRLATGAEATGSSFNQPTGLTIDFLTGLVNWDTQANAVLGGLYSIQVIIEDRAGSSTAPVKTQVAVDFLIYIIPQTTPCDVNIAPQFDSPTPTCGTVFTVNEGQPVSFTVAASDLNDDTITLNSAGIPVGATLTPALPVQGNPVSSAFNWTPSAGQAGAYVVTFSATDSCGAQVICSYTIQVNAITNCHLHIGCRPVMPTCYGGCNGSISVNVTGGSGNYSYLWSNGATTNPIGPICSGTYTLTVTDLVTQCTVSKIIILKSKPKIGHIFTTVNATCGFCNGSLTIAGKGGNGAPFTYLWSTGSTDATITGLCPATYTVTITDKLGCTTECHGKIVNKVRNCRSSFGNESDNIEKQISVYPNPFGSTLTLNVVSDEALSVTVRDVAGRVLATYKNITQSISIENNWKNGMYFITAENESRSYLQVIKVIKQE